MDFFTHSVNVPAERAKLRALRDEIAADVAHREAIQRRYTARGFLRDVPALEPETKPADGEAQIRPLRPSASVGIPAAFADVRETQAGCCGRCSGAGCMAGEGVNHEITGPSWSGA